MEQRLSIITICYNDLKGLQVTIPSILSQSCKDFEWIIVDGASTDGSREYIEETAKRIDIPRLFWASEPDRGIYNAMNKGVAKATGEYCLFLNAGDVFCSPKSMERAFSNKWDADIISCDEFVIGKGKFWDYIQSPRKVTFQRILRGYLPHQTTFIKRELLLQHPYHEDYKIVADWAFWWECLVVEKHTYLHFDFPLAAFDCTGVSSTNHDKNQAERMRFLSQYIPDRHLLEKITNECLMGGTIEGDFLINSERALLKNLFLLIRRVYVHFVAPVNKIYVNIRWRG